MKNVLGEMWADKCDVYEYESYLKEDGSDGFREKLVFSALPCRVSYGRGRAGREDGSVTTATQGVKLFLSNEFEIKPNSRIVAERNGVETAYKNSSPPAVYSRHQEILLELA